jgi:tRNA U34 5-carboxymethylaminomethyl modifying enzyme MnmG/GidA
MRHGLLKAEVIERLRKKESLLREGIKFSHAHSLKPDEVNPALAANEAEGISENERLSKILKRPEVGLSDIIEIESVRSSSFFSHLRSTCDAALFS